MSGHRFKVGEIVNFSPGKLVLAASSRDYKIIRLIPAEGSEYKYRIKSAAEPFERIARESELSHG